MKRPAQHVTDTLGVTQVRRIFETLGWVVREVTHDYGVDLEVEVFEKAATTGVMFKVQLKSSQSTSYSADGSFVPVELSLTQARYLVTELGLPVLLMHADVSAGRTFWSAPQLDPKLASRIKRATAKRSITLRIPTASELPSGLPQLLATISKVEMVLASRVIVRAPLPDFAKAMKDTATRADVIREFKAKAAILEVGEAHILLLAGRLDEAAAFTASITKSQDSSVEAKFSAILMEEMIEERRLQGVDGGDEAAHVVALKTARRLQALSRRGPPHLKFYALILRKAAELDFLVHRDWGLFFVAGREPRVGDALWSLKVAAIRAGVWRAIERKYRQCVRLMNYASRSKHRWALSSAILRVAYPLRTLQLRFTYEGRAEVADRLRALGFEITQLAASIASEVGDEQSLAQCASTAAMLATANSGQENVWALTLARSLKDPEHRKAALELIHRTEQWRGGKKPKSAKKATNRQIFENMFAAIGMDVTNPDDPVARLLRTAIDDVDPSRVLRDCMHSFVLLEGRNHPLADRMGLQTARPKAIVCLLHRYRRDGLSLDAIFVDFKREFCDKCPDRTPHDAKWGYTEEWGRAQFQRYSEGRPGSAEDPGKGGPKG